jgi:hypothetical protein
MQDKLATGAVLAALVCVVVGAIAHFLVSETGHVLFTPRTWHMAAQTCLLFAIARALMLAGRPKA